MPQTYQRPPILPVVSYVTNPEPKPLGQSPFPLSPASKLAKDAAKLWGTAEVLWDRVTEIQNEAIEAGQRLTTAQEALSEEVERGALSGKRNRAREAELVAEIERAEIDADAGITQRRYRVVLTAQRAAVDTAHGFVRSNIAELIEQEYRPLAETVWADLEQAKGDRANTTVATLDAAQAAYQDVSRLVSALHPWAFDKQAFVVPDDGLPLPPVESYTRPEAPPVVDAVAQSVPAFAGI